MLISHRFQFIYTKTSKTAGTSIEAFFEEFCMPQGEWTLSHGREEYVSETGIIGYRGPNAEGKTWYNHMPALEIRERIGSLIWDKYFKFCVIRNPFEKAVSAFHFFLDRRKTVNLKEEFRQWINNGGLNLTVDRDKYLINDQICVDFLIRYENLLDDIRTVCERLGVPFNPEKLPNFKSGIRPREIPITHYYDTETIEKVAETFVFEIKNFGYDFPA